MSEWILPAFLFAVILWLFKTKSDATKRAIQAESSRATSIQQLQRAFNESDEKGQKIGELVQNVRYLESQMGEMGQTIVDLTEKLESTKAEEKKQKGRAASAHTTRGQILEKWCPFLEHPQIDPTWDAKSWSFLGNPIDYIVWSEKGIVFLDVKSGKASLSAKQRAIRNLIREGKVEWREIRLD